MEKHLCESCAADEGIPVQDASISLQSLTGKLAHVSASKPAEGASPTCGQCGLTYSEFRQHGLLGCPDCYHAFEEPLTPLLERAHEGAAEHLGKAPRRSAGAMERQREITLMRKSLTEALATEQYERAAELRDRLRDAGVDIASAGSASVADNPDEAPR